MSSILETKKATKEGLQRIQLSHGGGGRMSREFLHEFIASRFSEGHLNGFPDAVALSADKSQLVFSTDSFVVQPLEFPGGNIGDLAVHGTVNDLAVSGGKPRWLSLSLILEEGLLISTLESVLDSIKKASDICNVSVVTGDTKVVRRGQCDGMYINTAGIGEAIPNLSLSPANIRKGDVVIVSGTIGDHGMAVMSAREGLPQQQGPVSDTASVHRLVERAANFADSIRFMRDPTRGGLAAALNEVTEDSRIGFLLEEDSLPYARNTRAVAEMLGLDLMHVACEGRVVVIADPSVEEELLTAWHELPEGVQAVKIGDVTESSGQVILQTLAGGSRLIDLPQGEILPRIC